MLLLGGRGFLPALISPVFRIYGFRPKTLEALILGGALILGSALILALLTLLALLRIPIPKMANGQ